MTTKPNDAKPSDSILGPLNLTLAGGWELGSIQQVLIAMLRREDEQLADSSNEGMGSPGISRVEEAALAKPESTCHHHRYTQDCPQCAYTPVVDEAIGERDALKSKLASVEAANRSLSAQLTMWQDAASKRESALAEANARAERLEGERPHLLEAARLLPLARRDWRGCEDSELLHFREAMVARDKRAAGSAPSQPLQDAQPVDDPRGNAWNEGYERGYDDREKMDHDRADVIRSVNPYLDTEASVDAQPVEGVAVGGEIVVGSTVQVFDVDCPTHAIVAEVINGPLYVMRGGSMYRASEVEFVAPPATPEPVTGEKS